MGKYFEYLFVSGMCAVVIDVEDREDAVGAFELDGGDVIGARDIYC